MIITRTKQKPGPTEIYPRRKIKRNHKTRTYKRHRCFEDGKQEHFSRDEREENVWETTVYRPGCFYCHADGVVMGGMIGINSPSQNLFFVLHVCLVNTLYRWVDSIYPQNYISPLPPRAQNKTITTPLCRAVYLRNVNSIRRNNNNNSM